MLIVKQSERVLEFVAHALEQEPGVQAIATTGIAKLVLSGVVNEPSVRVVGSAR